MLQAARHLYQAFRVALPYLLLVVLPGGFAMALSLWWFRRRKHEEPQQ